LFVTFKNVFATTCKNPLLTPWNKSIRLSCSLVCRPGVLKRFCIRSTIHQKYHFATPFIYAGVIIQLHN